MIFNSQLFLKNTRERDLRNPFDTLCNYCEFGITKEIKSEFKSKNIIYNEKFDADHLCNFVKSLEKENSSLYNIEIMKKKINDLKAVSYYKVIAKRQGKAYND